jgi:hypothetical protein
MIYITLPSNFEFRLFFLKISFIFNDLNFSKIFKLIIMRKIFTLIMLLLFSMSIISAQSSKSKIDPVGKWKFEAPFAPEGFTSGIIDVSFAENKYSTSISFTGSDYIIPGDKTKVENDTVSFVVLVEGNEVAVTLKAENDAKMTGKAVYSEGEIPLTLTKDVPKN